jgi:hypothetical protein
VFDFHGMFPLIVLAYIQKGTAMDPIHRSDHAAGGGVSPQVIPDNHNPVVQPLIARTRRGPEYFKSTYISTIRPLSVDYICQ